MAWASVTKPDFLVGVMSPFQKNPATPIAVAAANSMRVFTDLFMAIVPLPVKLEAAHQVSQAPPTPILSHLPGA